MPISERILLGLAGLLWVASGVTSHAAGTNTVVNACVNKTTGVPRIVVSSNYCNPTLEVFTQWNSKGVTGATGPQGLRGLSGPRGPAGPTGTAGVRGPIGPTGLTGPRGVTGVQGVQGVKGATGPAGPQGPKGQAGSVNPIPDNLVTLSSALGTDGYSGGAFQYPGTCVLGDIILSVNSYGSGALPADGRLLPINQNTAVFSLLGTRFGGDGRLTFGLPDLRAFAPAGLQYSICMEGIFPPRN